MKIMDKEQLILFLFLNVEKDSSIHHKFILCYAFKDLMHVIKSK